ncbi:MAG: hypothetical protein ACXVLQ_12425 [Bacteriovorax sp.]
MKNLILCIFIISSIRCSFAGVIENPYSTEIYLDGAQAKKIYKALPEKLEKWEAGWTHKEVTLDCYMKLMGSDNNPRPVYKCDITPVNDD